MSLLPLLLNRNRSNRPTLNLEFTANPVPASVTFTRATTATYVNSAGSIASAAIDAPRIDYDPVTLACKGLLIEEARTRLNTVSLLPTIAENVTVAAVAHTISFYGTGTVTLSGTSTAGPLVGSGAYPTRSTLTFTPTAGTLTLTPSGSVNDLQLEAGSFATSVIRGESGSQVTRAADVAVMTGSNFSSWWNAAEGTFVLSAIVNNNTSGTALIGTDAANINPMFFGSGSTFETDMRSAGGALSNLSAGLSGATNIALGYQAAVGLTASINGGSVVSVSVPSLSISIAALGIGRRSTGATASAHIKRLTFYPVKFPAATLQALSA